MCILLLSLFCSVAGVKVNVCYDGEPLSKKNKEKLEFMLAEMSGFYSNLDVDASLDLNLIVFKTQQEGYAYMREIYPNSKQYRKTRSDAYFGSGVAGVYMPSRNTAAILGLEKGIEEGMKVIYHEISHHFTHVIFGKRTPPIWLNEGLAEYFEYLTYRKNKGWYSDFPELGKGKLRTMLMLDELRVKDLLDMPRDEFMAKHRNEGQTYYTLSHAVIAVIIAEFSAEQLREFMSRMVLRNTDMMPSDVLSSIYSGGITSFELKLQEFIMN